MLIHAVYFLGLRIFGDNYYADGINYSTDTKTNVNPFAVVKIGRMNNIRAAAAYNALKSTNTDFDVLVHPTYETRVENYLVVKKYYISVNGYGATYSNFRTERQKVVITSNGREYVFPDN